MIQQPTVEESALPETKPTVRFESDPIDFELSREDFEPIQFLYQYHSNTSYADLLHFSETLVYRMDAMAGFQKRLLKTHFNRFLNAKDAVAIVFHDMQDRRLAGSADRGTKKASDAVTTAFTSAIGSLNTLISRGNREETLRSRLFFIKQNSCFLRAANDIHRHCDSGSYVAAVETFKRALRFLKDSLGTIGSPISIFSDPMQVFDVSNQLNLSTVSKNLNLSSVKDPMNPLSESSTLNLTVEGKMKNSNHENHPPLSADKILLESNGQNLKLKTYTANTQIPAQSKDQLNEFEEKRKIFLAIWRGPIIRAVQRLRSEIKRLLFAFGTNLNQQLLHLLLELDAGTEVDPLSDYVSSRFDYITDTIKSVSKSAIKDISLRIEENNQNSDLHSMIKKKILESIIKHPANELYTPFCEPWKICLQITVKIKSITEQTVNEIYGLQKSFPIKGVDERLQVLGSVLLEEMGKILDIAYTAGFALSLARFAPLIFAELDDILKNLFDAQKMQFQSLLTEVLTKMWNFAIQEIIIIVQCTSWRPLCQNIPHVSECVGSFVLYLVEATANISRYLNSHPNIDLFVTQTISAALKGIDTVVCLSKVQNDTTLLFTDIFLAENLIHQVCNIDLSNFGVRSDSTNNAVRTVQDASTNDGNSLEPEVHPLNNEIRTQSYDQSDLNITHCNRSLSLGFRTLMAIAITQGIEGVYVENIFRSFSILFKRPILDRHLKRIHDSLKNLDEKLRNSYRSLCAERTFPLIKSGTSESGYDWSSSQAIVKAPRPYTTNLLLCLCSFITEILDVSPILLSKNLVPENAGFMNDNSGQDGTVSHIQHQYPIMYEIVTDLWQEILRGSQAIKEFGPGGGLLQARLDCAFLHRALSSLMTPSADELYTGVVKIHDGIDGAPKKDELHRINYLVEEAIKDSSLSLSSLLNPLSNNIIRGSGHAVSTSSLRFKY